MSANKKEETRQEKLTRLEDELEDLKSKLPEHCYDRSGYIATHRASPALWKRIEEVEEEIETLRV